MGFWVSPFDFPANPSRQVTLGAVPDCSDDVSLVPVSRSRPSVSARDPDAIGFQQLSRSLSLTGLSFCPRASSSRLQNVGEEEKSHG